MIQVMIKGRVTGATIRISREKKANTDLYNQKKKKKKKKKKFRRE